jgi:hypothetical protein
MDETVDAGLVQTLVSFGLGQFRRQIAAMAV